MSPKYRNPSLEAVELRLIRENNLRTLVEDRYDSCDDYRYDGDESDEDLLEILKDLGAL